MPSGQTYVLIEWEEPTAHDDQSGDVNTWFKTLAEPRLYMSMNSDPFVVEYKFEDAAKNEAVCSFVITAISKQSF